MKGKIEKRKYLFLVGFLLITFSFIQGVYAQSIVEDLNGFVDGTVNFLNPFFGKLLGDTTSGEDLFAKVLFFIIALSLVWLALSKIPFFNPEEGQQLWVIWVVSIAISILSVRFLTDQAWIQTIILPYTTLGVVLSAGMPFIIYFVLVELGLKGPEYKTIRKVAWIFFAVVFIGLYVTRAGELKGARNIYFVTAVLSIFVTIFDGTFQRMLYRAKMGRLTSSSVSDEIDVLQREIRKANQDYARGTIDVAGHRSKINKFRARIKVLQNQY